jgi:hypothetical protein
MAMRLGHAHPWLALMLRSLGTPWTSAPACVAPAHTAPAPCHLTAAGGRDLEALQAFITEVAEELTTETSS